MRTQTRKPIASVIRTTPVTRHLWLQARSAADAQAVIRATAKRWGMDIPQACEAIGRQITKRNWHRKAHTRVSAGLVLRVAIRLK